MTHDQPVEKGGLAPSQLRYHRQKRAIRGACPPFSTGRYRFMRRAIAAVILVVACSGTARADGGRLRLLESAGPWRIAVFTSPTPLRAGEIDVSVLVERADTGAIVHDVAVTVRAEHVDTGTIVRERASDAAATNKLFQAAACRLTEAGTWQLTVTLAHPEEGARDVTFAAEVAPSPPPWVDLACSIGWPLLPVGLFVVHQILVARKGARSSMSAG